MMKKIVFPLVSVLLVILSVTGSVVAQQEIEPPEIQEARAKMKAITVSLGPENQFNVRAPEDNPEYLTVSTFTIPTDTGCNPIPNIPKDISATGNLGENDVPFAARARYCPEDSTLRMKAAPVQSSFSISTDTLRSYGFLALKKTTGSLVQPVVSFDVTYKPTTQVNPQIEAVFDVPLDGGHYVPHLEVTTKQMPCNNGGSAVSAGLFAANLGSLTINTHAGCGGCGTLEVSEKLKDSSWKKLESKKYQAGNIRWSNELPEGTYKVTFVFCNGSSYEYTSVINADNQNPIIAIPGQYGVCLPLINNMIEEGCPTNRLAKFKTSGGEKWLTYSNPTQSFSGPIIVGGCSSKVTISYRKGTKDNNTVKALPNGWTRLWQPDDSYRNLGLGPFVELYGCTDLVGLYQYRFKSCFTANNGDSCCVETWLKDPPEAAAQMLSDEYGLDIDEARIFVADKMTELDITEQDMDDSMIDRIVNEIVIDKLR
jgi:hypothetical protein